MPPKRCASCGKDQSRLKLVSCLHSLCLACLEQCIQDDGSVKCPSCATKTPQQAGTSLLLSLPNSYPEIQGEEQQTGQFSSVCCDECDDGEVAVSRCQDCSISLCDLHCRGHRRSKATRGHVVRGLAELSGDGAAASAVQTLHNCAVHPSQGLTHFCMPCNKLLCQRCIDTGTHKQSNHDVLLISDAAVKTRESVQSNLKSRMSGRQGILDNAMERVRVAVRTLNDQTENASKQATDFFKGLTQELEKREKSVVDDLDQVRASKLLLLEKQLSILQEAVSKEETAMEIFSSCKDNVDFLRSWLWLNNAIDTTVDVSKQHKEPCTSSAIVFNATDTTELLEAISTTGSVLDLAEGTLACTDSPTLDADVNVVIETSEQTRPLRLSPQQLEDVNLSITITEPDNNIVRSSSLQQSTAGRLEMKYRPRQAGQYVVAAAIADKHLRGSPVKFSIEPDICAPPPTPVFDVNQCHPAIQISNNSLTIRKIAIGANWRSVCTAEIPEKQGTSHLRIRIDHAQGAVMCICACSSPTPRLDRHRCGGTEAFGWWGHRGDKVVLHGTRLGQPWRNGDVIRLTLDHDKHTLTGLHERTGTTEVLENVTGHFYWYVTLASENDQLTILTTSIP